MKTSDIKGQIDFAIITIREDEFTAALQRLLPTDQVDGQTRYSLSAVTLNAGETRSVVVVRTSEQGEGEAQNAVRDLIEDLGPDWLVLVEIAGVVPARDFTLATSYWRRNSTTLRLKRGSESGDGVWNYRRSNA